MGQDASLCLALQFCEQAGPIERYPDNQHIDYQQQ
jgi:hypothetical protein